MICIPSYHTEPIQVPVNPVITCDCNFDSRTDFAAMVLRVLTMPLSRFTNTERPKIVSVLNSMLDQYDDLGIATTSTIIVRARVGRAIVLTNTSGTSDHILFQLA